jgi:UTRA domain
VSEYAIRRIDMRGEKVLISDSDVASPAKWTAAGPSSQTPAPAGSTRDSPTSGTPSAHFTEEVRVRVPDDDEVTALGIDPDHRVYILTRVAADRAGRLVEVNTIVMPTHQWTLAHTWQAE